MYIFGELPSDLDQIEESLGPPPSWFRPEQGIVSPQQAYWQPQYVPYGGLGEREEEIEVNPVEQLRDLKFKQEMNRKIPKIASRSTNVDPMSPLFRDKKAKFGYGGLEGLGEFTTKNKALLAIAIVAIIGVVIRLRG